MAVSVSFDYFFLFFFFFFVLLRALFLNLEPLQSVLPSPDPLPASKFSTSKYFSFSIVHHYSHPSSLSLTYR